MQTAVEKGDFGDGPRSIVRNKDAGEKGAHFAASVEFFTVKCGDREFKVVGKIQPSEECVRDMMKSDLQFHTEVLMYKEILPFLGVADLFPKMYFGQAVGNHKDDVILLQDMGKEGYRVTSEKLYLSVDHLRLAVKSIGRVHAASFAAKYTRREAFDALKSKIRYKFYYDKDDPTVMHCLARGVNPLMKDHADILKPALEAMQSEDFVDTISKVDEPWGVICHGDFCRNNMLFKYDGDTPVDVKLFDLQTSRYTSPAIDLSFFLYLNTNKATRDLHWDSLLRDYLNSFKSHLPPDITIDDKGFYDDFAARAVYGYLHCSFFTPIMMLDSIPSSEEFGNRTIEERVIYMSTVGGDEATQAISDIVAHLVEKGYINKFLEFIKNKKEA